MKPAIVPSRRPFSLNNRRNQMPILYRDIETRSTLDLKKVGVWRYAAEPSTGVWCVSFAIDDGSAQLWMPGQPIPEAFVEAARNSDWLVVARNDAFERAIEEQILAPRFGWPLVPIERQRWLAITISATQPHQRVRAVPCRARRLRPPKSTSPNGVRLQLACPVGLAVLPSMVRWPRLQSVGWISVTAAAPRRSSPR